MYKANRHDFTNVEVVGSHIEENGKHFIISEQGLKYHISKDTLKELS